MNTIGHNLSNASVEGYSRQRVELKATDPLSMPGLSREETPGQLGQGVDIQSIVRIRDGLLEERIVSQANRQGYWESRDKYVLMLEQVYNEPGEHSVRNLLDKFWESWQELSLNPSETAHRKAVLERGVSLMDGIHNRYANLQVIRGMAETEVQALVERTNAILDEIAGLSGQIVRVKAMGDNPNDLLDRRDLLVKELSGIIDITVDSRDKDEFTIHTGGIHLLQGGVANKLTLEIDPGNDGLSRVVWRRNGEEAVFRGGSLAGLLELRDGDIREEIQRLDLMTVNLADLVNEVHERGYGLSGETGTQFFVEYPFVNNRLGNYDRNGDGAFDSTYIFRISGGNRLSPQEQIGIAGTMTLPAKRGSAAIDYYPTDTVQDLVNRINNSGSEVVARLDVDGRLSLKATPAEDIANPDFVIRSLEDSGEFLVGYAGILNQSGPEGAYRWDQADAVLSLRDGEAEYAVSPLSHPSGWIEVNQALIRNPSAIAAGFGENGRPANAGDGSAALAIASIRNTTVMIGSSRSFDEYFADAVAEVGLKGETAARALETENLIMKDLEDTRQAISGVNIDEELAQMIKFQHGYSAASRFISEVTKMLDTIINRMGV
jgi:flagellar hook-associated protein 1 FlgK